jgi:hypothetical protein
MSTWRVFRLAGWGLGIAAGAWLIASLFSDLVFGGQDPSHASSPLYGPVQAVSFVAGAVTALGLAGHYVRRFSAFGKLALVGFTALFLSIEVFGAVSAIGATFVPWLEATSAGRHMLSGDGGPAALFVFFIGATLLQVIGCITYGIANWRAGMSRFAAVLLIASGALAVPGFVVGGPDSNIPAVVGDLPGLLFVAGLAWLGFEVAFERSPGIVDRGAALRPARTGGTA